MFFVYIIRSLKDGTFYYGSTGHLEDRVKAHNGGRVRYTKGHRPYVLHYLESFSTRSDAYRRERFFKSISGDNWLRSNRIIAGRGGRVVEGASLEN